MGVHTHKGFTIVEISMVLAISSLLLVSMATGVTLAVQRQRFSDSANGSQSFLQQQFNQTQNTINDRGNGLCGNPDDPGSAPNTSVRGASNCLVLGKLIELEEDTGNDESRISTFDVIAKNVDVYAVPYDDDSDITLIRSIHPTALKQTTQDSTYIVPWGARLSDIKDANGSGNNDSPVNFIGLFRSPRTGILRIYKIVDTTPFASDAADTRRLSASGADTNIQEITNDSVKMCLKSVDLANFRAMLEIIPSGSQDGIVTHFDDAKKENYPCAT